MRVAFVRRSTTPNDGVASPSGAIPLRVPAGAVYRRIVLRSSED
jgi:hypothetical protein